MTRKSKAPSLEKIKAPHVIEETVKGDNIENKDNKDRDPDPWDEGDLRFEPSNSMVHSFSSSSESNLSLSVGYFPCEDTPSCEDTLSCEDSSSEGPSVHFVPPIQGSWRTENTGRLLARRDQIQDGPEQFCKLSITLAWDVDVASNNSDLTTNCDLSGDNKDKHPKEKTQLTLSKLDGLVQKLEKFLENQKDDKDDDSVFPESAQEEDSQLPSSSLPGMAQIISEATGSQGTDIAEISSVLSGPPEKEDTHSSTGALSCLNFGWVFRWLRPQVHSSLLGREDPKEATERPRELAQKKRFSYRSKRIQPQESFELGHPIPPDF
ncbi:uncharacterized protein C12orf71 homolog [Bubalus bubalis]|uniref:uncharacterized protein C12orf71 homolog n=1 Tax=Bubalus bubalis TaxID=89462 RepID=UPI001E1B649E|nr:uncharacterized protein C12orf71 homolog [Bubalus bubalis]